LSPFRPPTGGAIKKPALSEIGYLLANLIVQRRQLFTGIFAGRLLIPPPAAGGWIFNQQAGEPCFAASVLLAALAPPLAEH